MIPAWAIQLTAGLALVLGAAGYGYHHGVQRERTRTEARIQAAEAKARAITARRFQTLQEAQDAEHLARQAAQRDAAAARAAADSLRQRAADFATVSCGAAAAPGSPPAAASGPGVLADVLGELAARADRLAEQADSARIAGQLCERAYDSLTLER